MFVLLLQEQLHSGRSISLIRRIQRTFNTKISWRRSSVMQLLVIWLEVAIPLLLLLATSALIGRSEALLHSGKKSRHHRDSFTNAVETTHITLLETNPCLVQYCVKGHECILNDAGEAECVCQRQCPGSGHYNDPLDLAHQHHHRKRLVCGSDGHIYPNHCELHRTACITETVINVERGVHCVGKGYGWAPTINRDGAESMFAALGMLGMAASAGSTTTSTAETSLPEGAVNTATTTTATPPLAVDNSELPSESDQLDNDKSSADHNTLFRRLDIDNNKAKTSTAWGAETEKGAAAGSTVNNELEGRGVVDDNEIDGGGNDKDDLYYDKEDCTMQEYEIMKDNLLLYNHARLMSQDNHNKDYLVSIMFSHYDSNNNGNLEYVELNEITSQEHLDSLSTGCTLANMIQYEDTDQDGKLTINEFYVAFSKLYSVSVVSLDKALETSRVEARVGDNVEIRCDVTGSPVPPIVWRRNRLDLTAIAEEDVRVFSDGSLYLTRIQLQHAGNYSCHAQRNKDVVQTHVLTVHTVPEVHVTPRIQSKRPAEDAIMYCHVAGEPFPKVEWLKNDEPLHLENPRKYQIIGNGTALKIRKISFADTGAYMCQATNTGGLTRDISSLVVQEQPTPTSPNEERRFFAFHDTGVSIYEPSTCRLYHQIQGTDIIPGTQEYVCGDKGVTCGWGRAVNVANRYVYATQPDRDRILIISKIQMVVVDVISTDKYPVDLHYVPHLDQVWVLNWRSVNDTGIKTIQVIRDAGQKRKHHTVHPEPIDGQFDLVKGLFIPSNNQELSHYSFKYGYVTHTNQRGLYKLDLANLRYTRSVDLTPYNCVPTQVQFSALYGLVIMQCLEPVTSRPSGQLLLDYLTDTVVATKPSLPGVPFISPDSRKLVTLDRTDTGATLIVQEITANGLVFSFDVKTTLNISDVTFYPSQTTHSYDLYASAQDKEDLLFLNLLTGKVEIITGVGNAMPVKFAKWANPNRPISGSDLTIQNTASCGYDIEVHMVQCFEDVDLADRDCSIMILLGGDMGHIKPRCYKNVTLLYPNMYLHNRKGSCLIKIVFTNKEHEMHKRNANISFDTTVSRTNKPAVLRGYYSLSEVSFCESVDLDPLNNCEPVDCHMKYLGTRSFFNSKWKRCQRVPKCVADTQKHLPDVVYTPITNKCVDMENLITKRDLRYLQSDEGGKSEASAISDDAMPMMIVNCHSGALNNHTGLCDCYDGWTSPPIDKDQNEPTLFVFHMCNIEVSNWYDINSGQIKAVALFIAIGAVLVAIFVIFISFIFHGLFICINRNRLPSSRAQSDAASGSGDVTKASSTGNTSSIADTYTQTTSK